MDIDTPNTQPSQELVKLPNEPTNPEPLQSCQAINRQSSFSLIHTRRGGVQPSPDELSSNNLWEDLRSPNPITNNNYSAGTTPTSQPSHPQQIVEAQGWIRGANGKVILIAQPPNATPDYTRQTLDLCQLLNKNTEQLYK